MTLYCIYAKPEAGPDRLAVLADRFSWGAFLVPPFWALTKGTVAFFVLWIAVVAALALAMAPLGTGMVLGLYAVFALWAGFAAPQIAGRALLQRNWLALGDLVAPDPATAERLWLERTYGARP